MAFSQIQDSQSVFSPFFFLMVITVNRPLTVRVTEPDWKLEGNAAWRVGDSQAEWVFKDKLWMSGGCFQSFAEPDAMCGRLAMANRGR